MNSESFVYRWREIATNKWYIGYHTGSVSDGYICSSAIVKPLIQSNPDRWIRKVLRSGSKTEIIALEKKLLKKLNASKNSNSYNRSNGNGTCYGGRPKGCKNKKNLNLNSLTAKQIAEFYKSEIASKNWHNVFLIDSWIMNKCVTPSSIPLSYIIKVK